MPCSIRFLLTAAAVLCAALAEPSRAQTPDHLVVGACGDPEGPSTLCPDGDPASLKLFSSGELVGASGHGPSIPPGSIVPVLRISQNSSYRQPRHGGYSFSTSGYSDLGMDYGAPPYNLALSKLPGPPSNFVVRLQRLAYDRPADFAVYTPAGSPRMVEDGDEYAFGTASNGGHVHPLFLMRRPGLVRWDMRFTSDQWEISDPYHYFFTSVPGRGATVPIDMSGAFNADLVDSDLSDAPISFDGAGHYWLLDGLYGTAAGLPVGGDLDEFQLGGPGGSGLGGSGLNALFDNGAMSLAATVDLMAGGQADPYLSLEFLLAGSGAFTSSDVIAVTLSYDSGMPETVEIKQRSPDWLPYRPLDDWQQAATPRPWLTVGRSGNRDAGFARSNGSGVDGAAGEQSCFFRATMPADASRTLQTIAFSDYAGSNRVAVFAILAVKKAPLVVLTTSLPDAQEGVAYSVALAAEGTPPYQTWSATGLPAGLAVDIETGLLSGTPEPGAAGGSPYVVEVCVEDSLHDYDAVHYPQVETATAVLELVVAGGFVPGDINGDGVADLTDVPLFVGVLLGAEVDPDYMDRSDLDGSGAADGADVSWMVDALLTSERGGEQGVVLHDAARPGFARSQPRLR